MTVDTKNWWMGMARVEPKGVRPPADVHGAMNIAIRAEGEKRAALGFATAAETKVDGEKRATVNIVEGGSKGDNGGRRSQGRVDMNGQRCCR